jgi:vancomycin resistance protein YoaR
LGDYTKRLQELQPGTKAINEQINGVIVPADATFSFNSLLGGPVTLSRGWSMALGIFDGGDLRPTPGGGICQTSTTTYRALLLAGLPIKVQRNHSLYVHYYEEYGVGLDATVFYGHQDLTFVNDTGHPLLLMSWIDGDDAFVSIYGSSDGRTVEMQGPYFWTNAPADLQINGREIRRNEIAWIRVIKLPNGAEARELRVSQYKQLPKNLARQYEPTKVASE